VPYADYAGGARLGKKKMSLPGHIGLQ